MGQDENIRYWKYSEEKWVEANSRITDARG